LTAACFSAPSFLDFRLFLVAPPVSAAFQEAVSSVRLHHHFSGIPPILLVTEPGENYNEDMKKTVFIIGSIITIIMLAINLLFVQLQKDSRPIVQGFIDASDIRFEDHQIAWLSGEWNFIPGQFVSPEAFTGETTPFNSVSLQVPAPWDSSGIGGSSFPPKFYGTYHLQIQLPDDSPDRISLYIPWINTAYACYADGELVFSAGTVGRNAEEHTPQYLPAAIPFTPESSTVDIVFHVSNFSHMHPGIVRTIMLGDEKTINMLFQTINSAAMFICGIMICRSAHHAVCA